MYINCCITSCDWFSNNKSSHFGKTIVLGAFIEVASMVYCNTIFCSRCVLFCFFVQDFSMHRITTNVKKQGWESSIYVKKVIIIIIINNNKSYKALVSRKLFTALKQIYTWLNSLKRLDERMECIGIFQAFDNLYCYRFQRTFGNIIFRSKSMISSFMETITWTAQTYLKWWDE